MHVLFICLIILASPFQAKALQSDCTANGLTQNCDLFKSFKGSVIKVLNGKFKNPLKDSSSTSDESATRLASVQDDIEVFLKKTTRPVTSRRFRRALLEPKVLSAIDHEDPVTLPWPPGSEKAKIRQVPYATFEKGYLNKLSSHDEEALQTLIERAQASGVTKADARKVSAKRIGQVAKLVEEARQSDLASVLKGRPLSALSSAEKTVYARLKTAKFIGMDHPDYEDNLDCDLDEFDSYYDSETHTFTICPAVYEYPDSNLIAILGHEIGHAGDPCTSQFKIYKVNQKKLNAYAKKVSKSDSTRRWALDHLAGTFLDNTITTDFARRLESPKLMDELATAGVLTLQTENIQPADYSLNSTVTCLVNKEGFRGNLSDPRILAREEKEFLDDNNLQLPTLSSKFTGQFPYCDPLDVHGTSHMSEAIADVYGTHALEDYFVHHPPKTTAEKLAPFADFYEELCTPQTNREKIVMASASDSGSDGEDKDSDEFQAGSFAAFSARIAAAHTLSQDEHPGTASRINKIYLKSAKIRTAMGCETSPEGGCTDLAATPGSDKASKKVIESSGVHK